MHVVWTAVPGFAGPVDPHWHLQYACLEGECWGPSWAACRIRDTIAYQDIFLYPMDMTSLVWAR